MTPHRLVISLFRCFAIELIAACAILACATAVFANESVPAPWLGPFSSAAGAQRLGQWTAHARDLAADFRLAFGHEGASLPPLEAVLVGADADNTGSYSLGYVEGVTLSP